MADQTAIEWCDATFNGWIGCTQVSPGCDHCYAAVSTPARALAVEWGSGQPRRRSSVANWKLPLRWHRADFRQCGDCGWRGEIDTLESDQCPACGKHERLEPARRRVFCSSLADVFDNEVPPEWLADLLSLIASTPNLDWLMLTKRIGNWRNCITEAVAVFEQRSKVNGDCRGYAIAWNWLHQATPPANVWLGSTICNQAEADRDITKLLRVPAAVRFLSIEPMLSGINFRWRPYAHQAAWETYRQYLERGGSVNEYESLKGIDWIIAGGESGSHARPMNPQWVRDLRDQCAAAGVPFLFKQWGEWVSVSEVEGDGPHYTFPDGRTVRRISKKSAGRLLDGVLHHAFPKVAP